MSDIDAIELLSGLFIALLLAIFVGQRRRGEEAPWRGLMRAMALGATFVVSMLLAMGVFDAVAARRAAVGSPVGCIGRADAAHRVTYLHGVDTVGPAWSEIRAREVLRAVAARLDVRFALPRCPGGVWPIEDAAARDAAAAAIQNASRECFGGLAPEGMIGFSRGGQFASWVYETRAFPALHWIVAASGLGSGKGTSDLSAAERFWVLGDTRELGDADGYVLALKRRGARVAVIEHSKGHCLPGLETFEAVRLEIGEAP